MRLLYREKNALIRRDKHVMQLFSELHRLKPVFDQDLSDNSIFYISVEKRWPTESLEYVRKLYVDMTVKLTGKKVHAIVKRCQELFA